MAEGDLCAFVTLLAVGILFDSIVEEFIYRDYIIGRGTHRTDFWVLFIAGKTPSVAL